MFINYVEYYMIVIKVFFIVSSFIEFIECFFYCFVDLVESIRC